MLFDVIAALALPLLVGFALGVRYAEPVKRKLRLRSLETGELLVPPHEKLTHITIGRWYLDPEVGAIRIVSIHKYSEWCKATKRTFDGATYDDPAGYRVEGDWTGWIPQKQLLDTGTLIEDIDHWRAVKAIEDDRIAAKRARELEALRREREAEREVEQAFGETKH